VPANLNRFVVHDRPTGGSLEQSDRLTAPTGDPTTSVSLEQSDRLIARLPFIEGIRGYAALIVVLGHCAHASYRLLGGESFFAAPWKERLEWLAWPANEMVYLFLMVSGFSLFYSEDVRRLARPATKLSLFARRRAWRILPTYYVAFAFGLLVLAVVPNHLIDGLPALGPEPVTVSGVIAHLFLLHNLKREWLFQGDAPLWSMAFEAQLYLLFPLLYWACKRYPAVLVCGAAIVLDFAIHHGNVEYPALRLLRWFALGILAADLYRRPRIPQVPTTLLLSLGSALIAMGYLRFSFIGGGYKHDIIWGAGYLLLLIGMTRTPASRWNPMNGRPIRWLGLRSYSLYAFHFPVLWVVYAALVEVGARQGTPRTALLFGIGVPLSIAVAHLAFRLVEQPSLRRVRALR
jgi:peptidoglycan/LPS O-acetylase OafA/YrhL